MEQSRAKTSKICRLCLEDLDRTTNFGIDLGPASEIRQLIKDIYTVEILPTDQVKFICVSCYKCLLKNHNNLVQRQNKKRIAQMNQLVLQAQQTSIEDTQENDAVLSGTSADSDSKNDSSEHSNPERSMASKLPVVEQNSSARVNKVLPTSNVERRKGSSNETDKTDRSRSSTPQVSGGRETRKSSLERSLRLGSFEKQLEALLPILQGDTKQEDSSSDTSIHKQRKRNEPGITPPSSGCLIPLVMDCMAHPEYLEALFPLKISRGPEDAKPLEYMCDVCFQTFKKEDDYRSHRKHGCTQSCRYCFAQIKSQHSCALVSKHSLINTFVKGSEKYCTRTDTTTENSKLNELAETPKGQSPRSHPSAEERKAKGSPNKSGHDNSPIKTTGKINRIVYSVESSSSSDNSSDVPTLFNVETSDEEYNNLLNDVRNKMRKKTKKKRIID
ncbi:uncharacterized protein LOC131271353 [Anopheles coustani]|uniref:uncharacterized protein LOC131271353 n=1 Tax=Anopheles coustani TaxID=139045 RepID=UPI0026583207|nr:uncharacterized protein LOC131271353 [Anopheles coustani]